MSQITTNSNDLVDRYVAVWNEPDAEIRRQAIRELWAPDGTQVLHSPPQEIRDAATSLRFATPALEVRGYEALDARVTRAYEEFVAPGEFVFRPRGDQPTRPLRNVVTFGWQMAPTRGGDVVAAGLEVVVLDAEGRITGDHQFIET